MEPKIRTLRKKHSLTDYSTLKKKPVVADNVKPLYIQEVNNRKLIEQLKKVLEIYSYENPSSEFVVHVMNLFQGNISKHVKRIYNTISDVRIQGQNLQMANDAALSSTLSQNINKISPKYEELVNFHKTASDFIYEIKKNKSTWSDYLELDYALDSFNLTVAECHLEENSTAEDMLLNFDIMSQYHSSSITLLEKAIKTVAPSVKILKLSSEYDMSIAECCSVLGSETSPVLDECLSHLSRNHCEKYQVNLKNGHFHLMDTETVYDVSAVLKNYLIHLPVKLFKDVETDGWCNICGLEESERLRAIQNYLTKFNRHEVTAIKNIMALLKKVTLNHTENKMDSENLATVFFPVLFPVIGSIHNINRIKDLKVIIVDMIENVSVIFPDIEPPCIEINSFEVKTMKERMKTADLDSFKSNSYPRLKRKSCFYKKNYGFLDFL